MTRHIPIFPRRIRYSIVTHVSTRPRLYYGVRAVLGRYDHLCVNLNTELVVEGFPRSANSTTVHVFIAAQSRQVRIAHHKHHAAQLLRAVKLNIPAVMLVRPPRAATLSFLALMEDVRQRRGQEPPSGRLLGYEDVFRSYIAFYRATIPILDRLVIAPFEEVTTSINPMIRRLNTRFGTTYVETQGHSISVLRSIGEHAMPTSARQIIKSEIEAEFNSMLSSSKGLKRIVNRAEAVHREIEDYHERFS